MTKQMVTVSEIFNILRSELPALKEKYAIDSLAVFGSYVRAEQHPDSDLDLLVTFTSVPSLFTFIEIENHLSDLLGVKVDLVMKNALKPNIGKRILNEALLV